MHALLRGVLGHTFNRWDGLLRRLVWLSIFGCATGVAVCLTDTSVTCNHLDGWTAGGGLAYAYSYNLIARLEYLYADYGTFTFTGAGITGNVANLTTTTNKVRAGLSLRFRRPRSPRQRRIELGMPGHSAFPFSARSRLSRKARRQPGSSPGSRPGTALRLRHALRLRLRRAPWRRLAACFLWRPRHAGLLGDLVVLRCDDRARRPDRRRGRRAPPSAPCGWSARRHLVHRRRAA